MMASVWFQFFLTFTRVSSLFVTLPITSYRGIPNMVKMFFALVVSYLLFTSSNLSAVEPGTITGMQMVMLIAGEALIGLILGFVVLLFFSAFRMAGQIVDISIGFSMASIFDPQFGGSVTLFSQFYYLFAILIYFAFNGHHQMLLALTKSFELIPLGGPISLLASISLFFKSFYFVIAIAFQIAAPVVAVAVVTDISMGLISKTVPQLHVFIVGMPLKILLALFVIYMTLPYLPLLKDTIFSKLYMETLEILGSIS